MSDSEFNVSWEDSDLNLLIEDNQLVIPGEESAENRPFDKLDFSEIESLKLTFGQNIVLETVNNSFRFKTGYDSRLHKKLVDVLNFRQVTPLSARIYRILNGFFATVFIFFTLGVFFAMARNNPEIARFHLIYGIPISFLLFFGNRTAAGYVIRKISSIDYADNNELTHRIYQKKTK